MFQKKKFKDMFVSCGMIKYFSAVFSRVSSGDGLERKRSSHWSFASVGAYDFYYRKVCHVVEVLD